MLDHASISATGSEPQRWLLVLHGIYGSGRNWGVIARRLVEERPDWGVVLVDLRLHGGSDTDFSPPHTVEAAAADVAALVDGLGITAEAILGHSYGGKIALAYTREHGEGLRQVWVVDSTLETREPSGSAWEVLQAVRSLPERFPSREAFIQGMAARGYPASLASWLGMNLERVGDELRWKLDWNGVEEMLRDYFRVDLWEVVERPPPGIGVHVVRASESSSIDSQDVERIRAAAANGAPTHLHEVEGGHWINADNPDEIVRLLKQNLTRV